MLVPRRCCYCCCSNLSSSLWFRTRSFNVCVSALHTRRNWHQTCLQVQREPSTTNSCWSSRAPKKSTPPQTPSETTLQATPGQRTINCQIQRARGRHVQFSSAIRSGKVKHLCAFFSILRKNEDHQESRTRIDLRIRVPVHEENMGKPSKSTRSRRITCIHC